jgi:hypothetical protein
MNWNPRNWFSKPPPVVVESQSQSADRIKLQSDLNQMRQKLEAMESLLDVHLDPDESLPGTYQNQSLYRQVISGDVKPEDSGRDFSQAKREEILRLSHQVYALRGDAYNITEIPIDFIMGDDIAPQSKDHKDKLLQEAVNEIWFDPRNDLYMEVEDYVRSSLVEGELFLMAEMSEEDGHLEFAYHPPENVITILQDDRRRDNFIMVNDPQEAGKSLTYFVMNHIDDKIDITKADDTKNARYKITETTTDAQGESVKHRSVHGLVFVYYNNRVKGATRGRPWLCEILDYVDIHDELIWSQVEREKLLKLFILDITAKDVKDAAGAAKKLKELGLEKPPTDPLTVCHNDKVEISVKAPETSGRPLVELEQVLRANTYGSKGLPEHWSGAGGGANFATARAQDVVPLRRLRRKQRQILNFWMTVIKVQLKLQKDKGASKLKKDPEFDMTHLEVGGRDRQRGATIMKDMAVAISQMLAQGVITREAANEMIRQVAEEGGYEISPANQGLPPEPQPNENDLDDFKNRTAKVIAAKKRKGTKGDEVDGLQSGEPEDDRRERRAS